MTVIVAWATGGVVLSVAAPRVIWTLIRRGTDPYVVLATWVAAVAGTLIAVAVPVALTVWPAHAGASQVVDVAHTCWAFLRDDSRSGMDYVVGAVGAVALALGLGRAVLCHRRNAVHRRRTYGRHITLKRLLGARDNSGAPLWIPVETPLAYSVAGDPPLIVMSEGLRTRLDPAALGAVLAHERAHSRGHHHGLVAVSELLAYALPWLPVMRDSPRVIGVLVEILADAEAVRSCGAAPVAAALDTLAPHAVPDTALAMRAPSIECTRLRRQRLTVVSTRGRRTPRTVLHAGAASAAAVFLPMVPVLVLVGMVTLTACSS